MKFRMANDRIMSLKEFVVKKISKQITYKEFVAINDVSFKINQGEVIGIIGGNGAGKSTLLKMITGILTPTEGKIRVNGSIAPLLELGAGFDLDLTARENIFLNGAVLGYSKKYLVEKYDEIVEFSELQEFMDTPVRNFSSGMTARLAFSIATLVKPDILIVDEILSVGDAKFQYKSSKRMRELISGGTTVILVSHSLEQIREVCNRVVWLEKGKVRIIGYTEEVINAYLGYVNIEEETDPIDPTKYAERLYTPTHITKIDELYFIVDCWHHRVIYNDNLRDEIKEWKTLGGYFGAPHSIVSDGVYYLVEDTRNDRVKVMQRTDDSFSETQTVGNIGGQPNKLIYDEKQKLFIGISSSTQEVFVLRNTGALINKEKVIKLDYLGTSYVRSISIIDGSLYIVSGPGKISVAEISDLSFDLVHEYVVPFEFQGMNDIAKIGSYFYMSIYQNGNFDICPRLIRVKDLNNIGAEYEDIYDLLGLQGVPYYFSFVDERVFLTEIDSYSAIRSFRVIEDQIVDVQVHYDFGKPDEYSLKHRKSR